MFTNIHLYRPLIFLDTVTTGNNIAKDRIIELSTIKFFPNGTKEVRTLLFDPTIPIPPAATRIHGYRDIDVALEPTFASLAESISTYFKGCDIGGFNSIKFDVPFLVEEFLRAGVALPFDENTKFVDAQSIYNKYEKRDLITAYKFYCDKDYEDAPSAETNALFSSEIFNAQIQKYDLEASVDSLHDECNNSNEIIDFDRKLTRDKFGDIIFNFGKNSGQKVTDKRNYAKWMLTDDFSTHTKQCIKKILSGELI